MAKDMFNEAEDTFKHAEKTMVAFWKLISPPFKWIWSKIEAALEYLFYNDDERTKMQLKKLPF